MRNGSFYDDLLVLCKNIYSKPKQDYKEWKYQEQAFSKDGLFVAIYSNEKDTVFVIRGTEDKTDLKTDLFMKLHLDNSQFQSAFTYYLKIKAKYKNIIFTGHSLGGSIAQYLGTITGNETITYEAYGVADNYKPKHTNNIINFGNLYDPIFIVNFKNHIGRNYIMPINASEKSMYWHLLENCGKPSQAKEITYNPSTTFTQDFTKPVFKDLKTHVKNKINDK